MDDRSEAAAQRQSDAVDEASDESFPASDAPSFWAGPDVDPRHRSATAEKDPDVDTSDAGPAS